jgi:hypothetical protein
MALLHRCKGDLKKNIDFDKRDLLFKQAAHMINQKTTYKGLPQTKRASTMLDRVVINEVFNRSRTSLLSEAGQIK